MHKEIRYATEADLPEILELLKSTLQELGVEETVDDTKLLESTRVVMTNPSFMLVATLHSEIVSCLGMLVGPSMLNFTDLAAKEIGWSVSPEHKQEVGLELFKAAIDVCADRKVNYIIGAAPVAKPQLNTIYKRLGGEEVETLWKLEV